MITVVGGRELHIGWALLMEGLDLGRKQKWSQYYLKIKKKSLLVWDGIPIELWVLMGETVL